jgi:hypothetical protein
MSQVLQFQELRVSVTHLFRPSLELLPLLTGDCVKTLEQMIPGVSWSGIADLRAKTDQKITDLRTICNHVRRPTYTELL